MAAAEAAGEAPAWCGAVRRAAAVVAAALSAVSRGCGALFDAGLRPPPLPQWRSGSAASKERRAGSSRESMRGEAAVSMRPAASASPVDFNADKVELARPSATGMRGLLGRDRRCSLSAEVKEYSCDEYSSAASFSESLLEPSNRKLKSTMRDAE